MAWVDDEPALVVSCCLMPGGRACIVDERRTADRMARYQADSSIRENLAMLLVLLIIGGNEARPR